jgi:tRNA/rRNA methyltransferase
VRIIKPSIVLLKPQLPENIGLVARAMDNCGLEDLIIVNPREKWPNNESIKSAANSKKIILKSNFYKSLDIALADFHFVVATSNRKRDLQKPYQNDPCKLFDQFPNYKKIAIIFGPENSGLSNEDLILADIIFNISTNESNTSLNLSHAVLLMSFSWRDFFVLQNQESNNNKLNNLMAPKKDFIHFMNFLRKELDNAGFLYPKDKSKSMFENIQSMFARSTLSKTEIKTLWGMFKKLRK